MRHLEEKKTIKSIVVILEENCEIFKSALIREIIFMISLRGGTACSNPFSSFSIFLKNLFLEK